MLISLLVAFALASGGAPSPIAASATSSPSSAVGNAVHGPCGGLFAVPSASGPGHFHGVLRGPNGHVLFTIQGAVLADPATPTSGDLHGSVVRVAGPNPGPFAVLHGHWIHAPNGADRFTAVIVVPGDPQTGTPPHAVGAIHSLFHDPNGPQAPAGHFHGHWFVH